MLKTRPLIQPIDLEPAKEVKETRAISIYKGFGRTFQGAFPRFLRDKLRLFGGERGRQDTKDDERQEGGEVRGWERP